MENQTSSQEVFGCLGMKIDDWKGHVNFWVIPKPEFVGVDFFGGIPLQSLLFGVTTRLFGRDEICRG